MEKWYSPPHQQKLAGRSVTEFGYDTESGVEYVFNQQGFRSPEISDQASVIAVGNSIGFGLGLPQNQTYGHQIAKQLEQPLINLSFGCFLHENHDHVSNLQQVAQRDLDDLVIVQINNLDRQRVDPDTVIVDNDPEWCVRRFCEWFDQCSELLKSKNKVWIYWDDREYSIPQSIQQQFLLHNHFHIDQSLPSRADTFGSKSHQLIQRSILASQRFALVRSW